MHAIAGIIQQLIIHLSPLKKGDRGRISHERRDSIPLQPPLLKEAEQLLQ